MQQKKERQFSVIISKDAAGWYVAAVPELKGCHTQARSLDTLLKRIKEAVSLCLEVRAEQEDVCEFIAFQRIAVTK
jgi:predicted RNase H-like HicB family nuclease